MDLQLQGKVALVTGGSRGIGKAVARVLAQEGARVALLARDGQRLAQAAAELARDTGAQVVGVSADTTNEAQVRAAVAQAQALLGAPVQMLVNAAAEPAGYAGPPKLQEIAEGFFHAELDTKIMGYVRTSQAVVPGMRALGWGRIVHISGLAARQTGNTVGTIRNVAVAALGKNMADELGPAGIQVNVVHPGLTRTERTAPLVAQRAASEGRTEAEVEAQMAGLNSIGHIVTAEEVAWVVAFLCSPKSRALNGDVIAAGGGARGPIHY